MSRGQIFTLNLWPSNGSRTRACNVRKMSRMYNTEGTPDELYQLASIVKRQIIYYLYMSKLIYPTWKILDKVYYCQTKRVEDKYKFLLSQFVQWCSIVCSVKNPFNEVTSTSEEKLSSPCHNLRFDTLRTNLGTSLGFDHNNEKVSSFSPVNLSGGQFSVTAEDRHLWNVSETLKEFTLTLLILCSVGVSVVLRLHSDAYKKSSV